MIKHLCCKPSVFYSEYEKGNLITSTPFSKVYLCKGFTNKENNLVVKIQKPHRNKNNIRNEINILKLLQNSKHITKLIYDEVNFFSSYIVFEKITGETLLEYLKTPQDISIKYDLVKQLLTGFKYLQSYHILHRDIKPDNIMVEINQNKPLIKIIDFGLARFQKNLKDFNSNEICGIYKYMCPEMLSFIFYNGSCDTWSLGVLFYYIFTYKYPYKINAKYLKEYMLFHTDAKEIIKDINLDIITNLDIKQLLSKMFIFDRSVRPLISELNLDKS